MSSRVVTLQSGVYSSLPYIGMCASSLVFGAVSDYLANNNYMKLVNVRRLANTIGQIQPSIFTTSIIIYSMTPH